jgi:hypothetical protein
VPDAVQIGCIVFGWYHRYAVLQEVKDAQMLGWTIEWLQAFFLVSDDIMDGKSRLCSPPESLSAMPTSSQRCAKEHAIIDSLLVFR